MKLYYSQAACSLASHIVLHETGLKFSTEAVNWESGMVQQLTHKGYVPVLKLDNGELLTEGSAILQYIADQAPEKNLAPKNGTMARYRCQEWLNYIATEVHKPMGSLFNPKATEEMRTYAKEDLGKKFDFLTESLQGKKFLMGEYTIADAYLFTVMNWAQYVKVDVSKWPAILAHSEAVKNRPATQAALKDEGLL